MSKSHQSQTSDKSEEDDSSSVGAQASAANSNSYVLSMLGLSGPDIPEAEIQTVAPLIDQYGQGLVLDWLKEVASGWEDSTLLKHICSKLVELHDVVDKSDKIITAAEAVTNTNAASSPGQKLMELHALFDLIYAFCPYIPGFHGFIQSYLTAIEGFAQAIDQLADTVSSRYRKMGDTVIDDETGYSKMAVPDASAFTGGKALHDYLYETIHIHNYSAKVPPDDVIEWVKVKKPMLQIITKEDPPATLNTAFGLDFLAKDDVDEAGLAAYFSEHASTIANAVYGSLRLNRLIYENVPINAG